MFYTDTPCATNLGSFFGRLQLGTTLHKNILGLFCFLKVMYFGNPRELNGLYKGNKK
jgi:hypothetical protein